MTKLFELGAVQIDTTAVQVDLDEVEAQSIDFGGTKIPIRPNGTVEVKYLGLFEQISRITFTTKSIKSGIDNVGQDPIKIDFNTSHEGLVLWFLQIEEGASYYSGGKHVKVIIKNGILIPRTLSASQGAEGTMSFEVIPIWDGTNNPLTIQKEQTYGVTPAATEQYTVGTAKPEGTELDTVESITVNFGIKEVLKITKGHIWPKLVGFNEAQPKVQIGSQDEEYLQTYGQTGAAISTPFVFFFRKKAADGAGNVADATEEHISVTVNKGHHGPMSAEGSQGAFASVGVEVTPVKDAANARFVFDTTAAIA